MFPSLKTTLAVAIAAVTLTFSFGAVAATTVNVKLSDDGSGMQMPTDMGMGSPGASANKGPMHVYASTHSVPAGDVTFAVTNASADLVHEMLVVKVDDPSKPLPFNSKDGVVDENLAGSLGEVSELEPGKSGSLSLNLKPGTYVLFCNLAGHFIAGMWTLITVT